MDTRRRRPEWQRNPALEAKLGELNVLLAELPRRQRSETLTPILFVVGSPRSGTTLAMQIVAASGAFAYPSNLISRFWNAPHLGQLVQDMIADPKLDFRGELLDLAPTSPHTNGEDQLGKTRGALQPNEFWYFWRRAFRWDAGEIVEGIDPAAAEVANLLADLAAWYTIVGKPIACKGLFANWNIRPLAQLLPRAVFLHLRRDPLATMASLLRVREDFYGDRGRWYSFPLPAAIKVAERDPDEQVAVQVAAHDVLIESQLAALPADRHAVLTSEALRSSADLELALRGTFLRKEAIAAEPREGPAEAREAASDVQPKTRERLELLYRAACSEVRQLLAAGAFEP